MQVAGVDDPGDERPGLLRVPAPVPAPGLVRPDRPGDDAERPEREAEQHGPVGEPVERRRGRAGARSRRTRRQPGGDPLAGVPVREQVQRP